MTLCRDLIRIDTTNPTGVERGAAEYVATALADVGVEAQLFESEPGRASVVARIAGADPGRPALLVHGHLDVVPADPADWRFPPFAGEIHDGYLWGRGAVDMKDMDAMVLAVLREKLRAGWQPPRDLILAFLADEENGGTLGAHWMVEHHPDLFEGATEAIGEVGGFSLTVSADRRLYLIETAEKGMAWLRLTAHGRAGHGSMLNEDNAVTALAETVARIGRTRLPLHLTATAQAFLESVCTAYGVPFDSADPDAAITALGPLAKMIGATVRNTANPTMLDAGYKINVVPGSATAYVDGRFLPGFEADFDREIGGLVGPGIKVERVLDNPALETSFSGPLVEAMTAALEAEDPGATVVPYLLSGGTDAKAFSRLGVRGFGFSPLRLPADLDFSGLFHGVDERVPLDALRFGVRVLGRFLDAC